MEVQPSWWGGYKMAEGSTRPGSANRDQPVCPTQIPTNATSSFPLLNWVWIKKKKQLSEQKNNVPNKITKSHLRD